MRKYIIGLSILFYALSGIFTIKAFVIPVADDRYENNPRTSQSKEITEQSTIEQEPNPGRVEVELIPEFKET